MILEFHYLNNALMCRGASAFVAALSSISMVIIIIIIIIITFVC